MQISDLESVGYKRLNAKKERSRLHSNSVAGLERFKERFAEALDKESIYAFAKRTGISESLIRKYLNGTSVPGLDNATLIARSLGVSLDWMTTGKGPKQWEAQEQATQEPSEPALDMPRLVDAMETVEAGLQDAHSGMRPKPKAELVALVYQYLEEEDEPTKLLRLVKDVITRSQQQFTAAL